MSAEPSLDDAPPRTRSRWAPYEDRPLVVAPGWTADAFMPPAPFFGVNGIRIAPDGTCWVAQHRAGTLSSWDADTEDIVVRSPVGGGITSPDDMAFARDGTVFVSELDAGAVRAMRPDGTYVTVHDDCPRANGITMGESGRLFVAEFRPDGRVVELDPARPGALRVVVDHAPYANAFERGPDGRLYYQNVRAGEVWSVDPDAGGPRREIEGLRMPGALKFDARGRLVVAESAVGRISAFETGDGGREIIAEVPPGIDNFCFDDAGRLYVSCNSSGRVVRLDDDGRTVERSTPPGLIGPQHLSVTRDGAVLAADALVASVVRAGGVLLPVWRLTLPDHGYMAMATADLGDALLVVTATGEAQLVADLSSPPVTVMTGARTVAPTPTGAVVGCADGRIVELGRDGRLVGERPSGLRQVTSLACHGSALAACDETTGEVTVLDGDERATIAASAEAVALGPRRLFVTRLRDRCVVATDHKGNEETVLARGLPFGMPRGYPRGARRSSLLWAPDDSLLVGCDGDGSILRLRPTPDAR